MIKLNISDIQHFSVGDGDGIRTTVFFKGCALRCPWCHNPETLSSEPVTLTYNTGKVEHRGKTVTVSEILPELIEDKPFFDSSGGGVTLSGGEVLLQPDGAAELSRNLRENGVTVLIDTAGDVPYCNIEKVLPYADGFLFDFKSASKEKLRSVVGGNYERIFSNLGLLIQSGVCVQIRIPVIPGFNDDYDSIRDICSALLSIGAEKVELLPFHRLGTSKYDALGIEYAFRNTAPLSKERISEIARQYSEHFTVKVEK